MKRVERSIAATCREQGSVQHQLDHAQLRDQAGRERVGEMEPGAARNMGLRQGEVDGVAAVYDSLITSLTPLNPR